MKLSSKIIYALGLLLMAKQQNQAAACITYGCHVYTPPDTLFCTQSIDKFGLEEQSMGLAWQKFDSTSCEKTAEILKENLGDCDVKTIGDVKLLQSKTTFFNKPKILSTNLCDPSSDIGDSMVLFVNDTSKAAEKSWEQVANCLLTLNATVNYCESYNDYIEWKHNNLIIGLSTGGACLLLLCVGLIVGMVAHNKIGNSETALLDLEANQNNYGSAYNI